MDAAGAITVRVKDGGLKCGDLDVQCNYADKVRQLKQMISAKSPLHPDVAEQRIIYSGHMLGDEQTLKDVFTANGETSQSSYTVHLAYRGGGRFNQPSTTNSQSSASASPSSTKEQPSSSQSNNPGSSPRLQTFSVPYHPGQPEFTHVQAGIHPDLLALHEYYVRQMMTYMIHWSQFAYQAVHPAASFDPNFPPARAYVIPQNVPQDPANAPPNDLHDNARANEVANRGEDDEAPRDVLDWMYTIVRVALIFSVVYFYSNFTRFFLVVLFTALVMVFQRRQQARQDEPQANQAQGGVQNGENQAAQGQAAAAEGGVNPGDDNRAQAHQDGDEAGRAEGGGGLADGNHGDDGNGNNAGGMPGEPRRSIRDITWTFLTTFFTSLIPDMPQNN